MSECRPFREVKLQWLQQLSCDADLSDGAKCVALYIITTHLNGHTEKAWPSYQTIADATGKRVRSFSAPSVNLRLKDGSRRSALEAKVRLDDLYTAEQLEAVLYAKFVESDYLPDERRVVVLEKLSQCFAGEEQQHYIELPARDR